MDKLNNDASSQRICPHLGLKNDQTTSAGYPSTLNICYHARGKVTPKLDYQRKYCLTSKHTECMIYNAKFGERMPRKLRLRSNKWFLSSKTWKKFGFFLVLILAALAIIISKESWLPVVKNMLTPAWQQTQRVYPTFTSTKPIESTKTATPTRTVFSTPTRSSTPSPTFTRTWVPVTLALDTPIGGDLQFVIHRVAEGEALGQFATQYNTTEAAIRSVNYNLPSILFVDRILVIPINIRDTTDLPEFDTFQVDSRGLSVKALAEKLLVAPEELSYYNNVPLDYLFNLNDWVLVPR